MTKMSDATQRGRVKNTIETIPIIESKHFFDLNSFAGTFNLSVLPVAINHRRL